MVGCGGSRGLLILNPNTVLVDLFLGLWALFFTKFELELSLMGGFKWLYVYVITNTHYVADN